MSNIVKLKKKKEEELVILTGKSKVFRYINHYIALIKSYLLS